MKRRSWALRSQAQIRRAGRHWQRRSQGACWAEVQEYRVVGGGLHSPRCDVEPATVQVLGLAGILRWPDDAFAIPIQSSPVELRSQRWIPQLRLQDGG